MCPGIIIYQHNLPFSYKTEFGNYARVKSGINSFMDYLDGSFFKGDRFKICPHVKSKFRRVLKCQLFQNGLNVLVGNNSPLGRKVPKDSEVASDRLGRLLSC